mgnify:FL=1
MQAIVAVSRSWGIGKDGQLLFHISADLQRFKALTTGHTVVMGRKTLQSLPGGRGLPNRRSLVLTRQERFTPERAETVHSLAELLALAGDEAFVIGGQEVYEQLLPYCTRAYVTKVFADVPADAFFPNLDEDPLWRAVSSGEMQEENGLTFQYVEYQRA